MNKLKLALAVSALLVGTAANAAVFIDNVSIGPFTTDLTSTTLIAGSLSVGQLDQFDISLGTLTGISISITGTSESTTILTNNSASAQSFSYQADLDWLFELDEDATDDFVAPFSTELATTSGLPGANFLGQITVGSGDSANLGTLINSDTALFNIAVADFASYVGAGTFGIGCTTVTNTAFSGGGGNIATDQVTTGLCDATVTYTYDAAVVVVPPGGAVPEPTILALMGLGLAGIGFSRRKMKK